MEDHRTSGSSALISTELHPQRVGDPLWVSIVVRETAFVFKYLGDRYGDNFHGTTPDSGLETHRTMGVRPTVCSLQECRRSGGSRGFVTKIILSGIWFML